MKTELELLREAAKEAKAASDKLALQLAELETKKENWSPKGGDWFLSANGTALKRHSIENFKKFGTERDTEAECKDLRKKQEWLNLTHAYACENDGVQEFVYGTNNWFVFESDCLVKVQSYHHTLDREKVYMTEKDAKEFARLCDEGLINFQFQGGE